jgi:hypothetical protein
MISLAVPVHLMGLAFDLILRARFNLFAHQVEAGTDPMLTNRFDAEPVCLAEAILRGRPPRNGASDLPFKIAWREFKQPRWMLNRQEPVEERPVPAEGDAEVFRRNVVSLVPFRLQLRTLGSKDFRQAFDRAGH